MKKRFVVLSVGIMVLLVSCSTTQKDWQSANQTNTIASFQDYLTKHPDSEFTRNANENIQKLNWQAAESGNTVEAFTAYLKQYPSGSYAKDAKKRIESLEFAAAMSSGSTETLGLFVKNYPQSEYIPKAKEEIEKLEWAAAEKTDTVGSYENFLINHYRGLLADKARANIQKIKDKNRMEAVKQIIIKQTSEPQYMAGGISLVAAPLSSQASLQTGKGAMMTPKKGHVFLMAKILIKSDDEIKIDLHEDAPLVDAQGTIYKPYVKSPIPFSMGWTAGGFNITEKLYSETPFYCMYMIPETSIKGARISLWGKDYPVSEHMGN